MESVIQCVTAFIGCFGFTFIFRIHKNLRFSFIGASLGAMGWMIYLMTGFFNNTFLQSFIAMFCVAIASEFMARIYKAPATIFIIVGCFSLVPGSGIYYTMLHAVQGQSDLFMQSFLTTLGISISLAFSILMSSTIFQVYKLIKTNRITKRL